jgi:pyruvate dehydrogenase E1 component
VPIIPDEARTFGMDSFFPTRRSTTRTGRTTSPSTATCSCRTRSPTDGQLLHEGINEAGATAAEFTAAGTSYATHGEPMIPLYIFYSMFGFQRTGDSSGPPPTRWPAGSSSAPPPGATTLTGEGLQHMDGHSPVLASTNPSVISYDPAYATRSPTSSATVSTACTARIPAPTAPVRTSSTT